MRFCRKMRKQAFNPSLSNVNALHRRMFSTLIQLETELNENDT